MPEFEQKLLEMVTPKMENVQVNVNQTLFSQGAVLPNHALTNEYLAETKNKPKAPAKKVAQDNFDSDSYAGGSAASNWLLAASCRKPAVSSYHVTTIYPYTTFTQILCMKILINLKKNKMACSLQSDVFWNFACLERQLNFGMLFEQKQ